VSKTASEYLVEALKETGVKRVYGAVGDSLNGFSDALRRRKSIDWITCAMRRLPPLQWGPKLISLETLPCALGAVAPATCI
jgi:Thiamine pyrophosphate enzyme, N-terminal TPP binding domain